MTAKDMGARLGTLAPLAVLLASPLALADGAFPDELQVFAPLAQPQRIVLSTNYGLILSDDDGATWSYVCETAVNTSLVNSYGIGPNRLYAISGAEALTSSDDGCTWSSIDFTNTGAELLTDLFGDPSRDDHAYVITFSAAGGYDLYEMKQGSIADVYPSPNALMSGVEVSQSSPNEVYAVDSVTATGDVDVLRSDDGGAGWVTYDHAELNIYYPGIAAVDPTDPATVYLRLTPELGGGDSLAVSHDSGQTVSILFTAPGALSAFAVDVDHSWYAGDRTNDFWYGDPSGNISQSTGPALRCLAARMGTVYGCGDEQTDGFVLGVSTNHGQSFQPLVTPLSYQTASCAPVRAVCPLIDGGPNPDAGPELVDAGSTVTVVGASAGSSSAGSMGATSSASGALSSSGRPASSGTTGVAATSSGATSPTASTAAVSSSGGVSSTSSASSGGGGTTSSAGGSSSRPISPGSGCGCSSVSESVAEWLGAVGLAGILRRRSVST